jgi:hypothetical protein
VLRKKIALCGWFCALAGGFFLLAVTPPAADPISAAISAPFQVVSPSTARWLPIGPLADVNGLPAGAGDGPAAVAPSVPEPWNYLSVLATVIPVSLLYWGLRRGAKNPPRNSGNSEEKRF